MLALPGVSPRSVPLRDLSAAAIYPPQRSIRRSDLSAAAIYPPQRSISRSDLSAAAIYPPQRSIRRSDLSAAAIYPPQRPIRRSEYHVHIHIHPRAPQRLTTQRASSGGGRGGSSPRAGVLSPPPVGVSIESCHPSAGTDSAGQSRSPPADRHTTRQRSLGLRRGSVCMRAPLRFGFRGYGLGVRV